MSSRAIRKGDYTIIDLLQIVRKINDLKQLIKRYNLKHIHSIDETTWKHPNQQPAAADQIQWNRNRRSQEDEDGFV